MITLEKIRHVFNLRAHGSNEDLPGGADDLHNISAKKNTRLGDRYNMQMINGRKKDMYDLSWR